jgi:hypothetical protein
MDAVYKQIQGVSAQGRPFAFVTYLRGHHSEFVEALVLGRSLRLFSPDIDRVLLITEEYNNLQLEALGLFWDRILMIRDIDGSVARIQWHVMGLCEYRQVCLLHTDCMLCDSIPELFYMEYPAMASKQAPWISGETVSSDFLKGVHVVRPAYQVLFQGLHDARHVNSLSELIARWCGTVKSLSQVYNYRIELLANGATEVLGCNQLEQDPKIIHFSDIFKPSLVLYHSEYVQALRPDAVYVKALQQNEGLLNARFKAISSSGTRNRFVSAYRLWLVHLADVCERLGTYLGVNVLEICDPYVRVDVVSARGARANDF